jgi:hypothetical protein
LGDFFVRKRPVALSTSSRTNTSERNSRTTRVAALTKKETF